MPKDCPHDRCHFFLWDNNAACPACGRRAYSSGPLFRIGARFGLTRSSPKVFAAATTLDVRYREAEDRANHWLSHWIELFDVSAANAPAAEDERALLDEAKRVAADAADDAVRRCQMLAADYVTNSLDRLRYHADLDQIGLLPSAGHTEEHVAAAVQVVEHYVDTLWLDDDFVGQVLAELINFRASMRRSNIVHTAERVTFLSSKDVTARYAPDADRVDVQRRRLRVERSLFLDN